MLKIKKKILLNAGHWDDPDTDNVEDPGAVVNNKKEGVIVMKIRDLLVPLLKQNFEVEIVPDELNLIESTKWVNKKVKKLNDGLALSIHLNAGGGTGAETLYYGNSNESKKLAQIILDEYCNKTGYENRGPKSDTTTRFKRNGWIRDTNCWSTLLECYFLDNESDREKVTNDDIAYAIYCSVCKLYKIKPKISKKDLIEEALKELSEIKIELVDVFTRLNNIINKIRGLKK